MITIENTNCVFFDCDDTLILWGNKYIKEDSDGNVIGLVQIASPFYAPSMYATTQPIYNLVRHEKHIKYLIDSKTKNHNTIVVWSAGGWQWAKAVVEALGIEQYVDAVMEKPQRYVDDLPAKDFMGTRIYKDFNHD